MLTRILATYLSKPFSRWLLRTLPQENPWKRFPSPVPLGIFGMGARRDFNWYFEGESTVDVRSIEEIKGWLLQCEYVSDPDLFREADFWQHPCTFEQLKKGDCEDFSLWAWRKLVRLGYDVEFVAGRCMLPGCSEHGHGHTWLVYRDKGATYVFDPIIRDPAQMIRPLEYVRKEYVPEVSVDKQFNRYVYAGYYLQRRGKKKTSSRPRQAAVSMA